MTAPPKNEVTDMNEDDLLYGTSILGTTGQLHAP
jgi:hypothetical protein